MIQFLERATSNIKYIIFLFVIPSILFPLRFIFDDDDDDDDDDIASIMIYEYRQNNNMMII